MPNPLWWIWGLIYSVGVWIGILQGGGESLLQCFTPVDIAYDVFLPSGGGDTSLSPIIFVHGTCSTKERWYEIPQSVADQTKRIVYSMDASNHGDSTYNDCFNYDIVAADILHFMEERNIEKAILIGHTMGGIASIKVALWNPEKVEKLVVENAPAARFSDKEVQSVFDNINLLQNTAEEVPPELDESEAYAFMNKKLDERAERTDLLGTSVRKGNQTVLITITRKPDGHYSLKCNAEVIKNALKSTYTTMSDNVGTYDNPVLFIFGTESPYRPDNDEDAIRNHFPNAQLEPVEGANRQLHGIYRQEFIDSVTQFIIS